MLAAVFVVLCLNFVASAAVFAIFCERDPEDQNTIRSSGISNKFSGRKSAPHKLII